MKPIAKAYFYLQPNFEEPLKQQFGFAITLVPISVGVGFDHEPSADEMQEAWDRLHEVMKAEILKRLE